MQHAKIILVPLTLIAAKTLEFLPSEFASCIILQDSRAFIGPRTPAAKLWPPPAAPGEGPPALSAFGLGRRKPSLKLDVLSPDTSVERRPLNCLETREVLHRILVEKNDSLIKDLVAKIDPDELALLTSRRPKDKKKRVKRERVAVAADEDEAVELYEDTGGSQEIRINDVRPGDFILHNKQLYSVSSVQHIAQARAKGHFKMRLKIPHTTRESPFSFPDGSKITVVHPNKAAWVYERFDEAAESYVFRGPVSELRVPKATNIPSLRFVKPGLKVTITRWRDKILNVVVPFHIEYRVVHINTGNYAATMENGIIVMVPTYIKVGDHIEVTTKAGEFLRRTKTA